MCCECGGKKNLRAFIEYIDGKIGYVCNKCYVKFEYFKYLHKCVITHL